jgi:type VI protein secretion system component VasK
LSKLLLWFFRIVVIVLVVLLVLTVVVLAAYAVYRTYRHDPPRIENLDERLPLIFHFNHLWVVWVWIVGLQAAAAGLGYWVVRQLRSNRASQNASESVGLIGRTPELDDAWKEIEIRSGRAFVDHVYMMLTPSEEHADALLDSSGQHIESRFPRVPSLLHASLTSGATFLTCVARPPQVDPDSAAAPSSAEYACKRLRAASSGRIRLQGVIVIMPVDWLDRPDAPRLATAYRGDLQAIARIMDVRPPVYLVVTGMESEPGFLEFAHRMQESFRTKRRCGFYLPGEPGDVAVLVHGGLVWLSGWYQAWMLYLMANEPLNQSGNNALFTLGTRIRRLRRRLPELVGTAMAAPQGGENLPLYGCYFAATGSTPDTVACAAGIIRGRVLENAAPTRWAVHAIDQDMSYRRAALAVGLVGGCAALAVWAYIGLGISSLQWLGLAVPTALIAVWIVTLLRFRRTRD